MVKLAISGELHPRGQADVLCNGQPFCTIYMDEHGNTRLIPPAGLKTALWDLFESFSSEASNHGDYPEDTLNKAEQDLSLIFDTVDSYVTPSSPSFIEVGLGFSVNGDIDQHLLDHLGQSVEMAVHRLYQEGAITPDDDDERIITLENVTTKKVR